ncbi:hypothetical protein HDU97_000609 [Phlyctochytrium planicorne]|nr:hypothetical protein HDU97_000609 [Phlyctochytrium planicorne]
MGRLIIFNRKINLAPDDLYVPAFYGVILHTIWLACTVIAYGAIVEDCTLHRLLKLYTLFVIIVISIQLPLDIIVLFLSMSGTVANPGPRKYLSPFIHLSTMIVVVELAIQCYGLYVAYGPFNLSVPSAECSQPLSPQSVVIVHMVIAWSFVALVIWFIILSGFLFSSGRTKNYTIEKSIGIWQRRLELFCFRRLQKNQPTGAKKQQSPHRHHLLADSKDVMRDVAHELADLFHDVDWAPSDIALGLILLKREQKRIIEVRQARRLILEQPKGFSLPIVDSRETMDELQALASASTEVASLAIVGGGPNGTLTMARGYSPSPTPTSSVSLQPRRWTRQMTTGASTPEPSHLRREITMLNDLNEDDETSAGRGAAAGGVVASSSSVSTASVSPPRNPLTILSAQLDSATAAHGDIEMLAIPTTTTTTTTSSKRSSITKHQHVPLFSPVPEESTPTATAPPPPSIDSEATTIANSLTNTGHDRNASISASEKTSLGYSASTLSMASLERERRTPTPNLLEAGNGVHDRRESDASSVSAVGVGGYPVVVGKQQQQQEEEDGTSGKVDPSFVSKPATEASSTTPLSPALEDVSEARPRGLLFRRGSGNIMPSPSMLTGPGGIGGLGSPSDPGFKPWTVRRKRRMHHRVFRRGSGTTPNMDPRNPGALSATASSSTSALDPGTPALKHGVLGTVTREEIDDILHFARFAEIVYNPSDIEAIFGEDDRMVRHQDDNGLFLTPYLIVRDPDTETVVVAVRGTFSTFDVLVDLKFDLEEFEIGELGGDEVHYAHSGMLRTARNIVEDIEREGALKEILRDKESPCFGWPLVVTGHSLGAGVAALVASMLRSQYPTASCYAYEPPGCLLSATAATHFESFCTSVIMGDDIVPRTSKNSMEMLKMDVRRVITACDHPKWRVFGSVLGARLSCTKRRPGGGGKVKRLGKDEEMGLGGGGKKGGRVIKDRPGLLHRRTPSGHLFAEDLALIRRRTMSLRAGNRMELLAYMSEKKGAGTWFEGLAPDGSHVVLPSIPMFVPGRILHMEKLRRPPLKPHQAIGGAIGGALNKAMEVTTRAGEKIRDGAEGFKDRILDGADRILDGADTIKDRIMDGADNIKEKIKDGAEGIKDGIKETFKKEDKGVGGSMGFGVTSPTSPTGSKGGKTPVSPGGSEVGALAAAVEGGEGDGEGDGDEERAGEGKEEEELEEREGKERRAGGWKRRSLAISPTKSSSGVSDGGLPSTVEPLRDSSTERNPPNIADVGRSNSGGGSGPFRGLFGKHAAGQGSGSTASGSGVGSGASGSGVFIPGKLGRPRAGSLDTLTSDRGKLRRRSYGDLRLDDDDAGRKGGDGRLFGRLRRRDEEQEDTLDAREQRRADRERRRMERKARSRSRKRRVDRTNTTQIRMEGLVGVVVPAPGSGSVDPVATKNVAARLRKKSLANLTVDSGASGSVATGGTGSGTAGSQRQHHQLHHQHHHHHHHHHGPLVGPFREEPDCFSSEDEEDDDDEEENEEEPGRKSSGNNGERRTSGGRIVGSMLGGLDRRGRSLVRSKNATTVDDQDEESVPISPTSPVARRGRQKSTGRSNGSRHFLRRRPSAPASILRMQPEWETFASPAMERTGRADSNKTGPLFPHGEGSNQVAANTSNAANAASNANNGGAHNVLGGSAGVKLVSVSIAPSNPATAENAFAAVRRRRASSVASRTRIDMMVDDAEPLPSRHTSSSSAGNMMDDKAVDALIASDGVADHLDRLGGDQKPDAAHHAVTVVDEDPDHIEYLAPAASAKRRPSHGLHVTINVQQDYNHFDDDEPGSPIELSKPLYPPSTLALKNKKKKGKKDKKEEYDNTNGKYHYIPRWARKEEFCEIIVSRTMVLDHFPFELLREFQKAPAGSVLGVVTRD